MNEYSTIKDIMFKIIGDYQPTTPQAVQVDFSGINSVTSLNSFISFQTGIANIDFCWVASAILLIVGFVCVMTLIRSILVAVLR